MRCGCVPVSTVPSQRCPALSQVAQAYRELLRREPDAGGMQGYMQLCAQRGIAPVRQSIQGSEEYRRLTSFFLFRGA